MIDVNGRLHSTEKNVNVIAGADEILDDSKNKKQNEINTETYSLVNDINERLSGLSPDQQSALSVAAKATNNETKLGYYVCGTEGNVAAKVISDATGYVLSTGGSIKVKMTNANTADNATLNINSTGAKPLFYNGERASANNTWEAGETVEVYYDGTNFYANNVAGSGGDGVFDVSEKYPTSGVEGGNTYTLDGALTVLNANLPASKKKGGMSIKFVQSSDNKYVQCRLMPDEFTTDTTQWAIAEEGVYVENPEFIYVKTDAEDKILWAIRTNGDIFYGAGVPSQVVNYINEKIADLSLDEYEDIVAFLNGLEEGDKTLQQLLNEKLDAEGLDAEALSMQSNINSQEYLQLTTDSEDKILEGIKANGTKVVELPMEIQGVRYETLKHPEFIKAILDAKGYVVLAIRRNGSIFAPGLNTATHDYQEEITELQNDVSGIQESVSGIQESVSEIQEEIANIEDNSYEIADGNLTANGSYSSELEASCIFNSENDAYVKYHKASKRGKRDYSNLNIIAVNHDDLAKSDYVGTRKIYNKYGFNANYNLILKPFATKAEQEEKVGNIKKLIADGNDLGLHAILGKSYWWLNKSFDIRPDSTFTFAPTLANIQGSEADHTGVNDFGDTITAVTKVSEIGFINLPTTALRELVVADMTAQDMIDVIRCYSIYGDYQYTISGLDLDGNVVSKTTLQWLEYWYNNLIDDTLGYSSTSSSIAEKFASDYTGTYPSKSEIKNGVITSNGVFTKGLFKGCKTCCNYEVIDRCIDVAISFIRHYFDIDRFTNFGRHGIGYFDRMWKDSDSGMCYDDSDKTILSNEAFKLYNTRKECWQSQFDILLEKGIKICNYTYPITAILEGQVGLYFGQKDVRSDFFNHATNDSGAIDYWNFFGTNKAGLPLVSYSDFETFLANENNWLKFAYENAGNSVTRNGKTFTMFECIYHAINVIRACKDTGKVPFFSVDTIINSPTNEAAVELICRYCYANNIRIVPVEEARVLVSSRRKKVSGNLFPNAGFNQGLYDFFNRDTTSLMAKIPDSWDVTSPRKLSSVSVDTETIDGKDMRVLTVECNEQTDVYTKIYGLQAGNYKLSFWAKSDNSNGSINVYKKYNKDYINIGFNGVQRFTPIETKRPGNTWVKYEVEFAIEYPHKNPYDGTDFENVICQGYEDNVSNVVLELHVQSDMSVAMPELVII